MRRRFGESLEAATLVDGIPEVLHALWAEILADGGLEREGIFRLSADESELVQVKRRLNQQMPADEAVRGASCICCAALIKAYLRELPSDVWAAVREGGHLDASVQETEGALPPAQLLQYLPQREAALLLWLCAIMEQVAMHEATNKMHVGAIAVVLAPNLLPCANDADPMTALVHTQATVKFMNTLLATFRGS